MTKALKGPYLCPVHGRCHGCAASDKNKATPPPTKMIFDRDMASGNVILRVVPA